MKRLFLLLATLLVTSWVSMNAQGLCSLRSRAAQSSLRAVELKGFGYADRNSEKAQGVGISNEPSTLLALIEIPPMGGNVLKGISFRTLGKDVKGKGAIVVMDAATKKVVYTQNAQIEEGNNAVALSTPFTFQDGKTYYVGYQIHADAGKEAFVLGFDGKESLAQANYFKSLNRDVAKDQTIEVENLVESGILFGSIMIFADIEDKKDILNDWALILGCGARKNVKANEKQNMSIAVRNIGANAIQSATVRYAFNGTDVMDTEKSVSIQPGESGNFAIEIAYPASGMGSLSLSLSKINGKDHASKGTPLVVPYTILSEGGPFPKETLLFEHFTTEQCGNCPRGKLVFEQYMETLKEKGYALSYVQHHAGFYTDFLTLKESEDLLPYYFVNGSFAPAFCIDRMAFGEEGSMLAGNTGTSEGTILAKAGESLQIGKFTAVEQKEENGKLLVTAKGTLVDGINPNLIYITAIVTEDNINAQRQAGASGRYVHHGVARLYLSSAFGDKATVNGKEFTITFPAKEIKADWKKEDLKVVLIAARELKSAKTLVEREVFFSTSVGYGKNLSTTAAISAENTPRVFINDGYISIQGWVNSFEVYDMSGRLVTNSTLYQLPAGKYVVHICNDFGSFAEKVIVR
jgi:hypothetical protein